MPSPYSYHVLHCVSLFQIRKGVPADLASLAALEETAFTGDRLSRRQLRHWLQAKHGILLLVTDSETGDLAGYILAFTRRNSRIARIYSLAIEPACRGLGLARQLLQQVEQEARTRKLTTLRLEVAENNFAAITLKKQLGYQVFAHITGYYEDGQNAIRMQKEIAES